MTIDRSEPRRSVSLVLLSLVLGFGCAASPAPIVRGPIPTRIMQPIGLMFPAPTPRTAVPLEEGRTSVDLDVSYASIFERRVERVAGNVIDGAKFDGEIARTSLRMGHGLGGGAEIVVEPSFLFASSGFLDAFVDGFHEATGFQEGGRELFPRDQYSMCLVNDGIVAYDLEEDRMHFGDLPITWVQRIRAEDENGLAVSTRLTVELPTGSEDRSAGSGGIDWLGGVLLERSLGRWTLTGGIDGMLADRPDSYGRAEIKVRKLFYASGGVEYRWSDVSSLLIQCVLQMPLTRSFTFEEVDREIVNLGFGYARDLGKGVTLRLSFHEDAVAASGADATFYAGLGFDF